MSHWSFATSIPTVLLGCVIWLVAAWLSYTNWRRNGRRKSAARLELLRLTLVTLLVFTLLRPEFIRQIRLAQTPSVAILADASGSMNTRDLVISNQVVSRSNWLDRQGEFWKPLEKNASVSVVHFASPSATNSASSQSANGTDINRALETVLQGQKNLKAVLLLTDGDWNQGQPPVAAATRYRERSIPVFAVATGRESPLPDLVLDDVTPPAYGLFGEQVSIPFKILSHLPHEVKTSVLLYDGQREEARKEITIPANSEFQDSILWSPTTVGDSILTLKLPVEKDEALTDNNEKTFRVSIRVDTLKVLVVDSLPRWEYRYLRNALARDPGVEMRCLLFHPGMGPGAGHDYLPAFPGTKEALSAYDVIFLGDVGIGEDELSEQDAELVKGLVEQQGSGLVFVPGRRARQISLLNSALKDLIPVVLDTSKPEGIGLQNESLLLLSSLGARHLLTRFDAEENRNAEIWKQLPGFYWSAAVEKSRPGSEVLAVHSSLRNAWGRMPLLVTRPQGNGKVLFLGTDSAWRWRRGVEDKYHYRFWSQVVRWMAHQRHLSEKQGIRVSFSPESPQIGDTVFLQATVLDTAGFPIQNGAVVGKITSPSGRSEQVEFVPLDGGWGVSKSSFLAQESGRFKLTVDAEKHGRRLQTELVVTQPQLEKEGQPVNSQVLREIASITRGSSGTIEDLGKILKEVSLLPEPKPVEKRIRLWADPWWGGSIVVLLGIYWTGRKVAGMM